MNERAMAVADDRAIAELILEAKERLIVLVPGLSAAVAEVLADHWRDLGADRVFVTLDVDPEVCRLGLGDFEAVRMLERAAEALGTTLNVQPGLRIGVIISDDQTLIYAPTINYVQAAPQRDAPQLQPNALRIGLPPADLERDLGVGPDGLRERVIGLDKATRAQIQTVRDDLDNCPPQPFDITRRLRVFTAHLEFVELRLTGCMVGRRTIDIPSDLVGLVNAQTQKLLRSKFRLLAERDMGVWGQEVHRLKDYIVERFLVRLPGFGYVIRRRDRAKFDLAVRALRKFLIRAKERKHDALQRAINRNIAALKEALLPAVADRPPERWRRIFEYATPAEQLDAELKRLAGDARDLLAHAKLEVRFKGVTYETLQDESFIAAVRQAMPDLERLHDEGEAALAGW